MPASDVGSQVHGGCQTGPRYQMYFSPIARADTFLVDTCKARVWQMVQSKDGSTVFERISVENPSHGDASAE